MFVAAGSLTGPFSQMISDYFQGEKQRVATVWGPSGVLRDRLEQGESFDVFASAVLPMADELTAKRLAGPTVLFARNALCAVGPEYGIALSTHAPLGATQFAMYVLFGQGQRTLQEYGFIPVSLPKRQ